MASPEKAVAHIVQAQTAYLRECGVRFEEPVPEKGVEVSPLVSLREEGLKRLSGVCLRVPCVVVDGSEVDWKGAEKVKEGVMRLKERVEGYSVYVLL